MPDRRLLLAASLLVALGLSQSCSDNPTEPVLVTEFTASLSGANERPNPTTSTATGTATVTIVGENSLTFSVVVTGMTNVTAGHIHIGKASVAGAVLVGLVTVVPPAGAFSGTLASGTITATEMATAPISLPTLIAMIRGGDTYVNVHTTANPGGDIRAQLVPK